MTMQKKEKREKAIEYYKKDAKSIKFPHHLGTHYSTSSYIFYYISTTNHWQNTTRHSNKRVE